MHFNINMEKAKRDDLAQQLKEQEIVEAKKRKQEAEDAKRRSELNDATNFNSEMQAQLKSKILIDRQTFLQEKDNIQTSLKSKVVEDAQENFRFAQRKQHHVDANIQNADKKYTQTQNHFAARNMQLQDEQRWLQQINEAKANEDNFLRQQRNERIKDLRNTYAAQQAEKNERDRCFIKH